MITTRRSEIEAHRYRVNFLIDSYKGLNILELDDITQKDCACLKHCISDSYNAQESYNFVKALRWYIFGGGTVRPGSLSETEQGNYLFRKIEEIKDNLLRK